MAKRLQDYGKLISESYAGAVGERQGCKRRDCQLLSSLIHFHQVSTHQRYHGLSVTA